VRKHAISCILCLAITLLSATELIAFTYEVHPGIYTSYEYSDNYYGVSRDEEGESTFLVGPSLSLRCLSSSATVDFTGRYTKSFHLEFPEDDSPDISLISSAIFTAPRQETRLSYEFVRTLTRESLTDPFGEVYRHTGSIGYSLEITRDTRMSAQGSILTENWSEDAAEEDLVDTGGSISLIHQLNPLNTITITGNRNYHFYEISQDAVETLGELDFSHVFSPVVNLGFGTSYNHADNGDDPNEDRYSATASLGYVINQSTTMSATGGYNWFVMEHEDVQGENVARLSLDKSLESNRFHFSIAKEYTSDYTANRYGTYDTRSAELSWIRQWLLDWSSDVGFSIYKRRPVSQTIGEFEIDSTAHASVTWTPVEYFTGNVIYEHLQTDYESSDTVRENRYRLVMEARY